MYGASVFKVAAKSYRKAVETALVPVNGKQIGKRLRGVIVSAVARVDDGYAAVPTATYGAPSLGWRMAIMSQYPDTTSIVSATLSPFAAEEELALEKPSTLPPSDSIADSKLSRVLVEGSKNSVASIL